MAKRAAEPFVVAVAPNGKRVFQKDEIVPDDVAKGRDALVYDDAKPPAPQAPYVRVPRDVAAEADKPKARAKKADPPAT